MNPTIQLVSGGYWNVQQPQSTLGAIDITAIAHALSNICRFTGHSKKFYSVAQHAVLCSHVEPGEHAYAKLLHDIAEAVLNDVASPLKQLLPDYKQIERRNEHALFSHFGLSVYDMDMWRVVKRADLVMLATERRDLMPAGQLGDAEWVWLQGENITLLPKVIRPWGHKKAKHEFLARFYELCPESLLTVSRYRHVWYHKMVAVLSAEF